MGLLSYLRGRSEARSIPSYGVPWGWWPTGVTQTGQLATPHLAENLATVCACVGAVSSAVASNPVIVYRKTDAGRTELPQHPVARLIASPWQMLTWVDWCEWLLSQVLLNGNAIAEIVHDGRGVVTGLRPIPWHNVNPIALPTGRMAFDVSIWPEPRRRLLQDQVFYLRDRSDDGWVGRSRISRAPDVIGAAASLQAFSAYAWENQATPSGAIQIEGTLNDATYSRLRARLAEGVEGRRNAKRLLVLDSGAKWTSLSVSPEDAQVLKSRRFTVEELCRLFQVPPPIIQDYTRNTFTNAAQSGLWFAQMSLLPWVRKIEAEFSRSVIGSGDVSIEIDLSGLMRGDYATRWAAYQIAVSANILTVDEVREAEGYSPRPAAPRAVPQ